MIIKSHLILVEGEEGVGKGYFAIWCLVQLAIGNWGESTRGLYLTSEEQPIDIQNRLMAAGWNPDKHAQIDVLVVNSGDSLAQLPLDKAALTALTKKNSYGMVVVDVLRDHCAPAPELGIKQRSNNDETWIRPAALAWERLAAETGATVLGLHHRNKSEIGSSRSKSGGSGAWRHAARLVLVLAEVAGDHAVAVDKQNIGRRTEGVWSYDLEQVTEAYGRFVLSNHDAAHQRLDDWEKAMRRVRDQDLRMDPQESLQTWCETCLRNGSGLVDETGDLRLPSKEVLQRDLGVSRRDLQSAITNLVSLGYLVSKPAVVAPGYGKYFWHKNGQKPH